MEIQGSKVKRIRPYHGCIINNISDLTCVFSPFLLLSMVRPHININKYLDSKGRRFDCRHGHYRPVWANSEKHHKRAAFLAEYITQTYIKIMCIIDICIFDHFVTFRKLVYDNFTANTAYFYILFRTLNSHKRQVLWFFCSNVTGEQFSATNYVLL